MLFLGAVFAVIMYLLSPVLPVCQAVVQTCSCYAESVFGCLIFPSMSVIRGFFQGFNNLKPYAISQIAEQVISGYLMLLTAFFIMKIGSGNYVEAVTQSTFAAFIGMLASMAVLAFYL